jgi:glucan phosphoethanolaminetransferase (alkaline phosphatase superfamily)
MNSEILKEQKIESPNNRTQYYRIALLSVFTIISFFIFEIIRNHVPENLVLWNGIKIKSIGLLILVLVIINSLLLPKFLNKLLPKMSIFKIVGITGLIILGIEFTFKIIQNQIVIQNGLNLDYITISKSAGLISLLSMLIANIYTHKINNKKTTIPILIVILAWISIGLVIKNANE